MRVLDVIGRRHSVRAYRRDAIDEGVLHQVLEAARLAPTACNRQPFRLIVVRTEGREADLARVYHRSWFREAPIVIGVFALNDEAWARRDGVRACFRAPCLTRMAMHRGSKATPYACANAQSEPSG